MTEDQLRKLVVGGETENAEFKADFGQEAIETAAAFANTRGGVILIGVADNGTVPGIRLGRETLRKYANRISDATEPRVIPDIESAELDGHTLVVVTIRKSPLKPVSVRGRCYRRVGNSNRTMTPQEIAEMRNRTLGTSWDLMPARNAVMEDIDNARVRKYVTRANAASRRNIEETENPRRVLENLNLLEAGVPTWSAVLLFGKQPDRFLSQAALHCGRFKQESVVIDDRMLTGTIVDQVDEATNFIRKNTNVRFEMTGRPAREEIWDYPFDALREALVNAVCHRDYSLPSKTELRIFDDRLEIWNPGGLPVGITLDDLRKPHSSVLRNKGIARVLYDIGWVENWGSGMDKMLRECRDAGLPEPELEEHQNGFRITFRSTRIVGRIGAGGAVTGAVSGAAFSSVKRPVYRRMMRILKVLQSAEKTNVTGLTEATGIPRRTLQRDLAFLKKHGVVEFAGAAKTGGYAIAPLGREEVKKGLF